MVKNCCRICKREFSTASGLTRHANAMHHGRTTLSHETEPRFQQSIHQQSSIPEHDENLWDMPITNIPIARQSRYLDPIPEYDENITPITSTTITPITNTNFPQVDDLNVEMEIDNEPRPRYNLRRRIQDEDQNIEADNVEERGKSDEKSDEEIQSQINLENIDLDPEDL